LILGVVIVVGIWMVPNLAAMYHLARGGQYVASVLEPAHAGSLLTVACSLAPAKDAQTREQLKKARGHLGRALDFNPNLSQAWLGLARANCLLGQPDTAVKSYQTFIELRPENPLGYLELGFALEAQCATQPSKKNADESPFAPWVVCAQKGFLAQMGAAWETAGVGPGQFLAEGERLAKEGQSEESLRWYARASLVAPGWGKPWAQAGALFAKNEDWENAAAFYQQAVRREPRNRDYGYQLGQAYEAVEDWGAALDAYANALEGEGKVGTSNVYFRMGLISFRRLSPPNGERAWEFFEQALAADDFAINKWERGNVYYQRGDMLARQQRWEEAIGEYEEALVLLPEHYWAHVGLARALWKTGQIERGIQVAKKALEISPERKHAYLLLGNIYMAQQDFAEAKKYYLKVQGLDPEDKAAAQALEKLEQVNP